MKSSSLIAIYALTLPAVAVAQPSPADPATHHPAATSATAAVAPMADGEVRKVDKEQSKVTLKHGPIASIDMPAMTMVFKVAEPRMLDTLKPGDKVKFSAEKVNGTLTVTAVEVLK